MSHLETVSLSRWSNFRRKPVEETPAVRFSISVASWLESCSGLAGAPRRAVIRDACWSFSRTFCQATRHQTDGQPIQIAPGKANHTLPLPDCRSPWGLWGATVKCRRVIGADISVRRLCRLTITETTQPFRPRRNIPMLLATVIQQAPMGQYHAPVNHTNRIGIRLTDGNLRHNSPVRKAGIANESNPEQHLVLISMTDAIIREPSKPSSRKV